MTIDINLRDIECMRDEQGVRCWLFYRLFFILGVVDPSLFSPIAYRKKARNIEVVVTGYHSVCGLSPVYTRSSHISPVTCDYKPNHPVLFKVSCDCILPYDMYQDSARRFRVLIIGNVIVYLAGGNKLTWF